MVAVTVLGFFANREAARTAARVLQRRGFPRSALVHKTRDGITQTSDPFLRRRVARVALAGFSAGSLVGLAAAVLSWPPLSLVGILSILIPILAAALIGLLAAGLWYRRSRHGVERKLLEEHARCLVTDETVLILQTSPERLADAATFLREGDEIPPMVFFLHPKRESPSAGDRRAAVALSLAQIEEHARRLAADHRVHPRPSRNSELLERLEEARLWIHQASSELSAASRLEQGAPPSTEWILDNEYVIEANARDIRLNLPRRFYQELPALADKSGRSSPRVYRLALELVSHTELRLDRENILAFAEAYQSVHVLTIGELWAYPQMLRIALIQNIQDLAAKALTELRDRELADFWANRLIAVSRRDHSQLFAMMAEMTQAQTAPSSYFASQLIDHLYDEEAAMVPVRSWLERTYRKPMGELNLREQNRQTQDQISIANAFTSLRHLALMDWRQMFEELSHVERTLRSDPAGVYARMDFETRDRYRRAVEGLARGCGGAQDEIALRAIERAAQAARGPRDDEPTTHVGSYLIGEGRPAFARDLRCRETLRYRTLQWVYRHPSALYFSAIGLVSAVLIALLAEFGMQGLSLWTQFSVALLGLIPISQLSLKLVNYLVTRLLPPRTLPKMDFEASGIPDAFRTLVVVPEMLVDEVQIRAEVEKLEIRYLANLEANLLFGLLTDYTDADEAHKEQDERLLQIAIDGLDSLNQRYAGGRFYLFHRGRTWSRSEQKFIGWERKRGKLEELNHLIDGTRTKAAGQLVHVGDPELLPDVRFIITLDSDTQLPSGSARRMVETLAHPLNQPRFDPQGQIVAGSYTIIQPRVSPSLPSTSATPFTRLFADALGIDPYTKAVSDVYQDLTGEGSYHGKGIYDVRAFSRVLSGTFPEESLLSHDLIEGAHVRVGLASDIELLDEFPPDYLSFTSRQHRWIRGDWQIADWVLPRVPRSAGRRGRNRLSGFNRWKISDNLLRSLIPATDVGLLLASWLLAPQLAWLCAALVALPLLFQPLAQPFTWVTTRRGLKNFSFSKVAHDLLRAFVEAALLPYQAGLALDAILRVGYRRIISHRGLLEWTSARRMRGKTPRRLPRLLVAMGLVSLFSGVAGWSVSRWMPAGLWPASPWLMLWFLSPLVGWLLNLRPKAKTMQSQLPEGENKFLRAITRRTWRYFSDFVSDATSWLPPDNYQVSHQNKAAMRTSPTNIGLWMLSALAASDFGYLTVDQVVESLSQTMGTINTLERYEGHLLNWYNIETLTPLEPRYVSAVDSGNLIGALWALKLGLEELIHAPLLDGKALEGLRDTWNVLREVAEQEDLSGLDTRAVAEVRRALAASPVRAVDTLRWLRSVDRSVSAIADKSRPAEAVEGRPSYWVREMERQVSAWLGIANRYLAWIEILDEETEADLAPLGADAVDAIHQDLGHAPSLFDLARGRASSIPILRAVREQAPDAAGSLLPWLDRLLKAFDESKWLAGEELALSQRLIQDAGELADSINMRLLYDPQRRLFSIGYNASTGHLDRAYYDLLASEARLGSFVAIAGGSVPFEHWFSMSRPYNAIGRQRVLLSWSGTMFEYLMPLILQRSYANSVLDKGVKDAVAVQIEYGRRRHAPWGISECAFGDLDIAKSYQYKAFGVPELGLKRGLEEELVVAPYASLLAITVAPRDVARNLHRLVELGLLSDFGFYEAVDYSHRPRRKGERGEIVRAYMAHHQGMGLLSLANFLHGNSFQRRFHSDPRVRAVESLLYERVPTTPPLHHVSARERVPSVETLGEVAPSVSKFETPHTTTPKTQLFSNGRYGLMLTNSGGGYSQWGDFEITRWRSDRTQDAWGTFCYLRETESGRLWSNTYHPVGGKSEGYSVDFALDRAVFRRADHAVHTETEIVVSPEDDVEIRRITLTNRGVRTRIIDLTSYVELSMAPHPADRQHPAFNKLFIQTEAVPEHQALLAYRRPRREDEPPIFVGHRLTTERSEQAVGLRFETDRRHFIGRGRTLMHPMGVSQEPGNSQGFVLDPILSLRRTLTLSPGEYVQVSLVLAASESREQILQLMAKYSDPRAIERAMDFAWASSQLGLRLLRIQPDDARRFQKLASHLLYPNPFLRPPGERIEGNRKGQAGLWPYGISGDLPIALVTVGETRDVHLVRQMLLAHTYWRTHGLKADLVILNEEASGYEQPLHEQVEGLIRGHSTYTGVDTPGGVYLRSADQIPEQDRALLMAAASVVLVAARGTLAQQLGEPVEVPESPRPLAKRRAPREPSAHLPFMELPYFNSLGGFTPDGREYAIYLGPDTHTPAPWVNVIANPTFGTLVSETGAGFTWYGNSQRNRLTQWSNDPVIDPPSEALYLRDEETGAYWSPTAAPIREGTAYRARHAAGYTVFEHNSHAIEQELTVLVPVDSEGGEPIKLQRLRLKNDSSRRRRLSLTYYVEWTLGESREASQMHVVTEWDQDAQALLARNRYHPEFGDRVAFAALSRAPETYTGGRTSFIGRNGSLATPAAMERTELPRRTGAGLDPCAALRVALDLAPGETTEITCMLGQVDTVEEVRQMVQTYSEDLAFETALDRTRAWWDDLLGAIQVQTPERAADFLINRWLLYQSLSCRVWGRSAFYQSGGAFGYRDQLQDVTALLYAKPELAREHILLAASRQFEEGDVQHWWHPPAGVGVRTRISDDPLWLPHVVAQYVRVTGDVDILGALIPTLEAPTLQDDQHDLFLTPTVSPERITLFEHCQRAVARGLTCGPNGLPLMGTGDWNDGMDLVGAGGKGESVWLAWFLAEVLHGMAEMSDLLGQPEARQSYQQKRKTLVEQIERVAWDGDWYLRATFDDGTPVGSSANSEARIDSLPQSWAWLSGAADVERARLALDSAWEHLVKEDEGLVLLFDPPFDQSTPSPGYIRGYPPGVRENGGQYTHAAAWLAIALARCGDGTRAAKVLRFLNPIERARDADSVWRYGVEPYAIAADVYRAPGRIGQGGWSWYTGSAAWIYRAWVEEVLGLKVRGESMRIDPVIPGWWEGFRLDFRHGEAVYEIRVENPEGCESGVASVELDGRRVKDGVIALERDLVKHRVLVRLGPAAEAGPD